MLIATSTARWLIFKCTTHGIVVEPRCSLVFLLTEGIVGFSVATLVGFNWGTDIGSTSQDP